MRDKFPSAEVMTGRSQEAKAPVAMGQKYSPDEINFAYYYVRSKSGRVVQSKIDEYRVAVGEARSAEIATAIDKVLPLSGELAAPAGVIQSSEPVYVMPPDPGEILPGPGAGESRPDIPRLRYLLELFTEHKIPYMPILLTGNGAAEAKAKLDSPPVRRAPYFVYYLPGAHQLVEVCEEYGNSTYIIYGVEDGEREWKTYAGMSKLQLKALGSDRVAEVKWLQDDSALWKKIMADLIALSAPRAKRERDENQYREAPLGWKSYGEMAANIQAKLQPRHISQKKIFWYIGKEIKKINPAAEVEDVETENGETAVSLNDVSERTRQLRERFEENYGLFVARSTRKISRHLSPALQIEILPGVWHSAEAFLNSESLDESEWVTTMDIAKSLRTAGSDRATSHLAGNILQRFRELQGSLRQGTDWKLGLGHQKQVQVTFFHRSLVPRLTEGLSLIRPKKTRSRQLIESFGGLEVIIKSLRSDTKITVSNSKLRKDIKNELEKQLARREETNQTEDDSKAIPKEVLASALEAVKQHLMNLEAIPAISADDYYEYKLTKEVLGELTSVGIILPMNTVHSKVHRQLIAAKPKLYQRRLDNNHLTECFGKDVAEKIKIAIMAQLSGKRGR